LRSDKGLSRKSSEERRERYNRYMRKYNDERVKEPVLSGSCYKCDISITPVNLGMRGMDKYICKECIGGNNE